MKFKRVIVALSTMVFLSTASLIAYGADIASDGIPNYSSNRTSSNPGSNWGLMLSDELWTNNADAYNNLSDGGSDDTGGLGDGGSEPGSIEDLSGFNNIVKGCAITVLYTADPKVIKDIKSFVDLDGNGTSDKSTADWMRVRSNRDKLRVWRTHNNSLDTTGSGEQKCLYSLSEEVTGGIPIINDFYPVGVGETSGAFDTSAWMDYRNGVFGFAKTEFNNSSYISNYNVDYENLGDTHSLWNGKMWDINASSANFLGGDANNIKEKLSDVFNDGTLRNWQSFVLNVGGDSQSADKETDIFMAFYIEPLISVQCSYKDSNKGTVWSAPTLFTPTMLAEYAKFSEGSNRLSSVGLYSRSNSNNFLTRLLTSTGTGGTSGIVGVGSDGQVSVDMSEDLKNMVTNFGRGAYEVSFLLAGGDGSQDDLPVCPSVPVIEDTVVRDDNDSSMHDAGNLANLTTENGSTNVITSAEICDKMIFENPNSTCYVLGNSFSNKNFNKSAADLNANDKIDVNDLLLLKKYLLHMIDIFPIQLNQLNNVVNEINSTRDIEVLKKGQ